MDMRFFLTFIVVSCLGFALILSDGSGWAMAQTGSTADRKAGVVLEQLKERAERVQERRKARISHSDRQAVADRAKAAKAKAVPGRNVPDKDGKGSAK